MDAGVRNVIFDMGNVLMTFDGPYFSTCFTDTAEDAALLQDALFGSPLWTLLDSGTISHETMARYARTHLPERLHANLEACIARWPDYSKPIEPVNDLAIRLKSEGYGIYVLSNASTRIMEQLEHAPVMPFLDGHVVSAEERLMKPDPAIVYDILSAAVLTADETLYVGDSGVDMMTARAAGICSVGVTWGFRSREELEKAGACHLVDAPQEILSIVESL